MPEGQATCTKRRCRTGERTTESEGGHDGPQSINQSMPRAERRSADRGRCNYYTSKLVTAQHKVIQRSEPGPGLAWPEGRTLMGMARHNGGWCKMEDGYSGTGWADTEGAKTRRWGLFVGSDSGDAMPMPHAYPGRASANPEGAPTMALPPECLPWGTSITFSHLSLPREGGLLCRTAYLEHHHITHTCWIVLRACLKEKHVSEKEGASLTWVFFILRVLGGQRSESRAGYRGPWPWNPRGRGIEGKHARLNSHSETVTDVTGFSHRDDDGSPPHVRAEEPDSPPRASSTRQMKAPDRRIAVSEAWKRKAPPLVTHLRAVLLSRA
jgi:hypothetical protein